MSSRRRWYLQQSPSVGSEYAAQFPHGASVVDHVLKHVTAVNHRERLVGKLDVCDVHRHHDVRLRRIEIRRDVVQVAKTPEVRPQTSFRRDVQHPFHSTIEKIGALLQELPIQTMPPLGSAHGTNAVFGGGHTHFVPVRDHAFISQRAEDPQRTPASGNSSAHFRNT